MFNNSEFINISYTRAVRKKDIKGFRIDDTPDSSYTQYKAIVILDDGEEIVSKESRIQEEIEQHIEALRKGKNEFNKSFFDKYIGIMGSVTTVMIFVALISIQHKNKDQIEQLENKVALLKKCVNYGFSEENGCKQLKRELAEERTLKFLGVTGDTKKRDYIEDIAIATGYKNVSEANEFRIKQDTNDTNSSMIKGK